MRVASAAGTGALNTSRSGSMGRQAACAFTRSHSVRTVKSGRVWNASACSAVLAMPLVLAMPASQRRRTSLSGGSVRRQRSTTSASSARARSSLFTFSTLRAPDFHSTLKY